MSNINQQSARPSYVLGNSWQLNRLSAQERAALDREPFVLTCNYFPDHWRKIGFRPTAWVFGDSYDDATCRILASRLEVIRSDPELRERLQYLFVCSESHQAVEIVDQCDLPIIRYDRGHWDLRGQPLATSLTERIYHYGSTLTDVVNIALLVNPGQEVRLCGCQYGHRYGYFYHSPEEHESTPPIYSVVVERMWQGFNDMHQAGINLLDCNFEHGPVIPIGYQLPRGSLLQGVEP